jgi:hypothetical protein
MGLEALNWDNLERIADVARDKYVNFSDERPGKNCCGRAALDMAYELYVQMGRRNFQRYVACVVIPIVGEVMTHSVLVVGRGGKDMETRFELGVKLDPTIYQFQQTHPELKALGKKCIFTDDYPEIKKEGVREDAIFHTEFVEKLASTRSKKAIPHCLL